MVNSLARLLPKEERGAPDNTMTFVLNDIQFLKDCSECRVDGKNYLTQASTIFQTQLLGARAEIPPLFDR